MFYFILLFDTFCTILMCDVNYGLLDYNVFFKIYSLSGLDLVHVFCKGII